MDIATTVKRVQQLGDLIEKLIKQSNEMRERVIGLEENVDATSERVALVEVKADRQSELLEAMARQQGIDPDEVYADAGLDGDLEELARERVVAEEDEGEAEDDGEGSEGTDQERSGSDGGDGSEEGANA